MITNVNLMGVWVTDIDQARDFYVDKLGFAVRQDVTMDNGYRWLTVGHPNQPDLMINLQVPGPPLSPDGAEFVRRQLGKGEMGGGGLGVDDCRKTFEELQAKGVEFVQEPSDRPYGVEAVMRDNSGNWWVLVERKEYAAEDFGADAEVRA